jgi:CheY-like chemotaxis protein
MEASFASPYRAMWEKSAMSDAAGADDCAKSILLVEDDSNHAELIRRALENHPEVGRLDHHADGESAMAYLAGCGPEPERPFPSLILLDLRLPRLDGLEVLRRVKGDPRWRSIPVVILTTSAAAGDMKRAYDLNANSYLVKPFDFEHFRRLLGDMAQYWLQWNFAPAPDGET